MATSKKTKTDKSADIAALSAILMQGSSAPKPQMSTAPAEKSIASKSNWTGALKFGMVTMNVKTLKATEIEEVSLNMVHNCNADGVKNNGETPTYTQLKRSGMKCPTCDIEVEGENILKGYQYSKGEFAIIPADLKKTCAVASQGLMHITSFVKLTEIDPIYFESSDYMVPEGPFAESFNMLRMAMLKRGVVAIAKSAQRGREQTVVIRPYGSKGMTVHYMFMDNEVRTCDLWQDVAVNDTDVEIAATLIDHLTDAFDPTEHEDLFMRQYKGAINDIVMGRTPVMPTIAAPVATPKNNLTALLQASLALPPAKKTKKVAVTA